jgi:hypothetical protein
MKLKESDHLRSDPFFDFVLKFAGENKPAKNAWAKRPAL